MLFNQKQIENLLNIIRRQHVVYGISSVGVEVLTTSDVELLNKYGIDPKKFVSDKTPFEQSFLWGKLSQALSDAQAAQVNYKDFLKYVKSGQYIPLSRHENFMLDIAKNATYNQIKDLGKNVESDINNIILEQSRRKIISESMKEGIRRRESLNSIVSEIGHKTGDWQRNLGRIVDTEYNNIYQQGRAEQLKKDYGDEVLVYKDVFGGACRHCIRLYLTGGIGSEPIIYKLSDLEANGTNYGKKTADWLATIGSTHPHCRCTLRHYDPRKVWDKDSGKFVFPEKSEEPIQRRKNKMTVGDKVFWV